MSCKVALWMLHAGRDGVGSPEEIIPYGEPSVTEAIVTGYPHSVVTQSHR